MTSPDGQPRPKWQLPWYSSPYPPTTTLDPRLLPYQPIQAPDSNKATNDQPSISKLTEDGLLGDSEKSPVAGQSAAVVGGRKEEEKGKRKRKRSVEVKMGMKSGTTGQEKLTETRIETMVLEWLRSENRPHSHLNVAEHLSISNRYASQVLKKLYAAGHLAMRQAGYHCVYHTPQELSTPQTRQEFANIAAQVEVCKQETLTLQAEADRLRRILAEQESQPTTEELRENVHELELENRMLEGRIRMFELAETSHETETDLHAKNVTEQEVEELAREAERKRQVFHGMWKAVIAHLPPGVTEEELWLQIGLQGSPADLADLG